MVRGFFQALIFAPIQSSLSLKIQSIPWVHYTLIKNHHHKQFFSRIGLHTRAVLDAIAESSLTGSWCQVNFIMNNGSDKSRMGSEESMVQVSNEQKKEKAGEKEYPLPVLRKMLTQ